MAKSKPSLSDVRQAEERAKADGIQEFAQKIGAPVSDAQASELARKRVREAMERNVRDGKL